MKHPFLAILLLFTCLALHGQVKMPPYLTKGDTVGIIATARKNGKELLESAIELLKRWGLHVVVGETIGLDNLRLAGADWQRAIDLQQIMDSPSIKAIGCAKGGYGTVRVVDKLDFTKF